MMFLSEYVVKFHWREKEDSTHKFGNARPSASSLAPFLSLSPPTCYFYNSTSWEKEERTTSDSYIRHVVKHQSVQCVSILLFTHTYFIHRLQQILVLIMTTKIENKNELVVFQNNESTCKQMTERTNKRKRKTRGAKKNRYCQLIEGSTVCSNVSFRYKYSKRAYAVSNAKSILRHAGYSSVLYTQMR